MYYTYHFIIITFYSKVFACFWLCFLLFYLLAQKNQAQHSEIVALLLQYLRFYCCTNTVIVSSQPKQKSVITFPSVHCYYLLHSVRWKYSRCFGHHFIHISLESSLTYCILCFGKLQELHYNSKITPCRSE